MFFTKADRWLMNNLIDRKRIFEVNLNECRDEFGGRYGEKNNHFFVKALAAGPNRSNMIDVLKDYYSKNPIKSFNSVIGRDTGHPSGKCYFLPWEKERVRPLEKFITSHKVGPTPDFALHGILDRLCKVYHSLKTSGFNQFWRFDGYIRLIRYESSDRKAGFFVRDGNHRMTCLSYLGHTKVLGCLESEHFQNSKFFRLAARVARKPLYVYPKISVVRESDVLEWPHVKAGNVSAKDALEFFRKKINETYN